MLLSRELSAPGFSSGPRNPPFRERSSGTFASGRMIRHSTSSTFCHDASSRLGTAHGEELPYLFGVPLVDQPSYLSAGNATKDELFMSVAMMKLLGNFVHSGGQLFARDDDDDDDDDDEHATLEGQASTMKATMHEVVMQNLGDMSGYNDPNVTLKAGFNFKAQIEALPLVPQINNLLLLPVCQRAAVVSTQRSGKLSRHASSLSLSQEQWPTRRRHPPREEEIFREALIVSVLIHHPLAHSEKRETRRDGIFASGVFGGSKTLRRVSLGVRGPENAA
ncbi:unnamed protein product [Notodromas monacha]|uniref:Uncharacterized protein n=1 Tax=Notodromas monacha TaxID=399045 RepID=A0A7R9BXV3_9CRUS|nr:unnamed protein product [Notodromas monacha]CAG0922411.1 unnamed protein product [Notodromas monacha]